MEKEGHWEGQQETCGNCGSTILVDAQYHVRVMEILGLTAQSNEVFCDHECLSDYYANKVCVVGGEIVQQKYEGGEKV